MPVDNIRPERGLVLLLNFTIRGDVAAFLLAHYEATEKDFVVVNQSKKMASFFKLTKNNVRC